ncbi:DUF6427 family protein [Gillisia limnaea]|uniref:Membrane protein n=1 Tax=Gillisia limnaea (strain DSM 15749 / LMG 21470 / R-8282) TaxID=865937 RepID=H2BUC1_GILLR|nr:DUF6427 family protein [Gillisia limnaea]EHQ02755.1 membrane protein [Gillisia limnaea DSM 15749]
MLTSFFSKSKPVNFLAVIVVMALFYVFANSEVLFSDFNMSLIAKKTGILICFIIGVWVLDFIARKNELTQRSAFKIVLFAVFSVSFLPILRDNQVIVANLCILMALRRIISLKSHKEIQKKIFDATFWICIASLFYFWSILFLIVVYSGILMYTANYFKNWLIPAVAVLAVLLLVTAFHIIFYDRFYSFQAWFQESSFNFQLYNEPDLFIPLSIILAVSFWTLFYYFGLFKKASINSRPTYTLVLITLLVSVAIAVFSPVKNGSEFIFFFVPLSIIASNYFESKREKIFKEILLLGLILMPVLIPIFF